MSLYDRVVLAEARTEAPSFLGVLLDEQSRTKLLHVVPPLYQNTTADHITITHSPTEEQILKFEKKIGKRVAIVVTATAHNGRIQAAKVKNVAVDSNKPHITISAESGAKQSEAKDLFDGDTTALQPWLRLNGVYGRG